MKSQGERPPFFGLLLRAVIWTPVCLLLTAVWLAAIGAAIFLPILGILWLWLGEYLAGAGFLALWPVSIFIATFIAKRIWEAPPSLL
jgi:hypothetical protein